MLAPDQDHSFSPSRPLSHQNHHDQSYGSAEIDSSLARSPTMKRSHQQTRCQTCCSISSIIFSLIFSIIFFVLASVGPRYIDQSIDHSLRSQLSLIDQSSAQYKFWENNQENPPVVTVYVYDIVNAENVTKGDTPSLREIGPFVFRDRRVKFNVSYQSNDQTNNQTNDQSKKLFYQEWQYYEFLPDQSVANPKDVYVTTLDLIFLGVYSAELHCGSSTLAYDLFNQTIDPSVNQTTLFIKQSVQNILFGWTQKVSFLSVPFPGLLGNQTYDGSRSNGLNGITVDDQSIDQIDDASVDQSINQSINRQYFMWNGQTMLTTAPDQICFESVGSPVWNTTLANTVRGSDAGAFSFYQSVNQSINPSNSQLQNSKPLLFYPPYQTAIEFAYSQTTEFDGVDVYRFILPPSFFDNSSVDPSKSAFYQNQQGGINLSRVSGYLPSFATAPRQSSIDQWSPLKTNLNVTFLKGVAVTPSIFECEPHTGLTVHFSFSSEVNILIGPMNLTDDDGNIHTWFPNVPVTLMPLMWAVEESKMSDSDARIFRLIQEARAALNWAPYVFYPLGSVCVVLMFLCCWRYRKQSNNQSNHQSGDVTERSQLSSKLSQSVYSNDKWDGSPRSSSRRLTTSSETYGWD